MTSPARRRRTDRERAQTELERARVKLKKAQQKVADAVDAAEQAAAAVAPLQARYDYLAADPALAQESS